MIPALLLLFLPAAVEQSLLDSGRRALEAGDLTRAEEDFRRFVAGHPDSAPGLSNLAAVLARREQYAEAVGLYRQALKADPKLVPVHFNLAVALGKQKEYAQATEHLRTFLKAYPADARGRQLLGLCLLETGDLRAALIELEGSYKANPKDGSIVYALAYANARAGDEERAAELLRHLESDPVHAKLVEGLIEYRRGRFAEAQALFDEVLMSAPDSAPALTALGRLELLSNRDPEAIRLLEHAIRLNPADAESVYQLGVLYDRNGRTEEGIRMLRRAIQLRARYADPHYQLGRIALGRGDLKNACFELEEARRILPDQEAIRLLLGRTYQALGRAPEAKAEFAEVRKLKAAAIERSRLRLESDALMKP